MKRARSILVLLAVLATAWAALLVVSGGVRFHLGALLISSREARNPALVAGAAAVLAWLLSTPEERRRFLPLLAAWGRGERGPVAWLIDPRSRVRHAAGVIVAVVVTINGLAGNAAVASGADAYGYASQADLWARGLPIVDQPFAREMIWPNAPASLTPLGYRTYFATPDATRIVPVFSPGYPMTMAIFERVAGRHASFVVVPLLAGVAVFATYWIGARLGGRLAGLAAAILLSTSPPFLFETMSVSSDVPVTAWWSLALALLLSSRPAASLGSGLAAGMAILTRPNLFAGAAVPGLLLVSEAVRARTGAAWRRVVLYSVGAAVGIAIVAAVNAHLYGSPLESGYGSLGQIYKWTNLAANLAHYPRWLVDAQTPIVLLAFIAPLFLGGDRVRAGARRYALALVGFAAVIAIPYFFSMPSNAWGDLRYLLPAYPALLVLASVSLVAILRRVTPRLPVLTIASVLIVVALIGWRGVGYANARGLDTHKAAERRYVALGEFIAEKLPDRAAIITVQHCGSVRYYSGRPTVRYDAIASTDLDLVIGELRSLGYQPYILLENWEQPEFRARFGARSPFGAVDWTPVATTANNTAAIFDPADRQPGRPDVVRMPVILR